ncbi:MAG TPA: hypothetical protein DCE71_07265 [Parachlamydiales bacterium]|nr:hypothetical protein [Parachlamydiales bacterium]
MKLIYFYPILLTTCGILIHAFGLLDIEYNTAPAWGHLLMLIIDSAIVIGLFLKVSWGYWLAVALFIQQTICQTYWLSMQGWLDTSFQLNIPVPLLCLAALACLIFYKKVFIEHPV